MYEYGDVICQRQTAAKRSEHDVQKVVFAILSESANAFLQLCFGIRASQDVDKSETRFVLVQLDSQVGDGLLEWFVRCQSDTLRGIWDHVFLDKLDT